ncbi:MAG: ATP phosphoribosyltransferase regulatory subunit, partial [Oscillospiraceae bacterium]|nr:ATP phosphoribosyltransferase regulatory subunit [Oscillospiraceae bacterium]
MAVSDDARTCAEAEEVVKAVADTVVDAQPNAPGGAQTNAPINARTDTPIDAQADSLTDEPTDAQPDTLADSLTDEPTDSVIDADTVADVQPDVLTDVQKDAPVDALVDAPVDAPVDALVDALVDAPVDALVDVLTFEEKTIMRLRSIYRRFGYVPYRMSKFEEYELYAYNRSFLSSDNIITFTDGGGKLMALRPDVTLSIVKNINCNERGGAKKLYYSENVYRPGGVASSELRERMQMGLELIGDIDVYSMCEVIMLALRSLLEVSGNVCIDISHMGFISGLLESSNLSESQTTEALHLISRKNADELRKFCAKYGADSEFCEKAASLASLYGPFEKTIGELERISVNEKTAQAYSELRDIFTSFKALYGTTERLRLDFSLVNDLSYYSGVIFQGFVDGIPMAVLSGGRYDKLVHKFGKKSGALGFAVFLDMLEQFERGRVEPADVDILLLYDLSAKAEEVARAVSDLSGKGFSVRAQRCEAGVRQDCMPGRMPGRAPDHAPDSEQGRAPGRAPDSAQDNVAGRT